MTCIAAVTEGLTVYMGGDSAASNSDADVTVRVEPKVFVRDGMVFGFEDSFRMGQLLAHSLLIPPRFPRHWWRRAEKELLAWMATDFIDAVRNCFKEGGYARSFEEQEVGGSFLVGVGGRLFSVDPDYHVGEAVDGYDAIGCGYAYAKGSLYSTCISNRPAAAPLSPEARILTALRAAERHSGAVRGPFTFGAA